MAQRVWRSPSCGEGAAHALGSRGFLFGRHVNDRLLALVGDVGVLADVDLEGEATPALRYTKDAGLRLAHARDTGQQLAEFHPLGEGDLPVTQVAVGVGKPLVDHDASLELGALAGILGRVPCVRLSFEVGDEAWVLPPAG